MPATTRRIRSLTMASAVVVLTACGSASDSASGGASGAPAPKVLVIGIDGVRPDALADVNTPAIDALIADGSFTAHARTGFPSVSGPGWSSFLIGVWPDKHGVTNNDFTGKDYDTYRDFLTRLEEVQPSLNTFAVADWLPLVYADDGKPTVSEAVDIKHVLDGYEAGWAEGDSIAVGLAINQLRNGHPDAMFVYLGNPDESSHESRGIGVEYREALALADRHVGQLVAAMRARPTYDDENWLIVISTDHGRLPDGDHGGDTPEERTIFFLTSGPGAAKGELPDSVFVVDVAVTALTHMGVVPPPAWNLDGKPVGLR